MIEVGQEFVRWGRSYVGPSSECDKRGPLSLERGVLFENVGRIGVYKITEDGRGEFVR